MSTRFRAYTHDFNEFVFIDVVSSSVCWRVERWGHVTDFAVLPVFTRLLWTEEAEFVQIYS